MSSSRKNFSTGYRNVKDDFQFAVGKIFEKQYKGRDCNNSIFIKVLFCALCPVPSPFAVCRNLSNVPGDHTIAAAILKTLPEYTRLQKLINQALADQLPKKLSRKPKRLVIDLVLIPYHGSPCYNINEIYRSQPKSGTSHFHAYATVCQLLDRYYPNASDQSCLNRFMTEVDWDVGAVNDARIEMMQQSEGTRFHDRGVIGLDDVLIDKTGKFIKDSGTFWDHCEKRYKHAQDLIIINYLHPASGKRYPLEFRRFKKSDQCEWTGIGRLSVARRSGANPPSIHGLLGVQSFGT